MPLPITTHSWPSSQQVDPVYPVPPHCSHASTGPPEHSPVGGGTATGCEVPATGEAVAADIGAGVQVSGITGAGVDDDAGGDVAGLTGEAVAVAAGAGVRVSSSPAGIPQ